MNPLLERLPDYQPSSDDNEASIAVVGMAGRFAGAGDIDAYWNNLRKGIESIVTLSDEELIAAGVSSRLLRQPNYVKAAAPLPDMEMFDAGFFGMSPREAAIMDPQHRHFLECAWAAIEDSGHPPERFVGATGVFAGSGHNAYMPYNLLTNPKLMEQVGLFLVRHTGNDKDFLTTRVSYLLNLRGPSVNVQTACSTSLVAIHMAVQSLLNRECDMALAGGATIELPHRQGYLYQEGGIMSPDGHCRAFDADSAGTVFGSGVGVVVLRRLADALADDDQIYAVIKGSAINNDGAGKVGYLAPSVDGQAQAITEALAIAGTPADTITYVEAHGTGTAVGDPIEVAALTEAYRKDTEEIGYCGLGSVKGNIGHTDTAAGVASFIKVALALKHGELPPSLHFGTPNPACELERSPFYVNAALRPWATAPGVPRRAGVSSLGVGGTNAHVIMEQAPPRRPGTPTRRHQLIALSGSSPSALDANTAALAAYFAQGGAGAELPDIAYTLTVGRQALRYRRVVAVGDFADAAKALLDPTRAVSFEATAEPRNVHFMFAGGGAQHPNMGLDLYEGESVFRDAVDDCLDRLATCGVTDVRRWLYPVAADLGAAAVQMKRPSIGLPALFAVQYGLSKLWEHWGITPKAMIGHSLGEYMAAHLAGVMTLDDALGLVALRGRLFETLPAGGMLSVSLAERDLAASLTPELSIAAVNGPSMTVVSGPNDALGALKTKLEGRDVPCQIVPIDIAAHSSMLAPILAEWRAHLRRITLSLPTKPFVSGLTGTWISPAEATDPGYWVNQMRHTVRFGDGVAELVKDPNCVLVEMGPGRALASLAKGALGRQAPPVFASMRHMDETVSDVRHALDVLGRIWATGAMVNWGIFWQSERRLRIHLPTYRFDRHRHWIEPGQGAAASEPDDERREDVADWFHQPVWTRIDAAVGAPAGATTLVFEDELGVGAALGDQLFAHGADVVRVRAGQRLAWSGKHQVTIDPASPADYAAVIARLAEEGRVPRKVAHCWMLTGNKAIPPGVEAAEALQPRGFYSLLALAQALGGEDIADSIDIAVITDHMLRVATEGDLVPAKATVLGPCKVIPREMPGVTVRAIDVLLPGSRTRAWRELVAALTAELSAPDEHEVVAYRAGERWAQNWRPIRLQPTTGPSALKREGVYLITGGLGGIGLALARHLAQTVAARIVLVSRSMLPPRTEWAAKLHANDPDDPTPERIRQVMAIERLGGEVLVINADATNPIRVRHAIKQVRERFGGIDGVFHTAGVLDDGLIALKEPFGAAAVLAPKLQGTLVLEEALAEIKPDFVMLFSSVSATFGLAGQIDYAAANAFLDAYARSKTHGDGPYVVAVDWSQWQEVGMAAALARTLGSDSAEDAAAAKPTGNPLLGELRRDTPNERTFVARYAPDTHWLLDEHRFVASTDGKAPIRMPVIPGAGYMEIVRAALAYHAEDRPMEIANVVFLAPFAVADGAARELRLHLNRRQASEWQFTIEGREVGADADCGWLEHVRGEIAYVDALCPADVEIASIRVGCRNGMQNGQAPTDQMHFGARWDNIERVDFGVDEAVISLVLPERYSDDLEHFALHPALLDFATAGAQAIAIGDSGDFFVPASYRRLMQYAPLAARMVSHVRYRGGAGSGIASYDVTICDENGRVLVDISEFTMLKVDKNGSFAAVPPPRARARPPSSPLIADNQVNGIAPAMGMKAIEMILNARAGQQIVVSPQPFAPLLVRLRAVSPVIHAVSGGERGGEAKGGAPESPAERLVAELWREMLGISDIGVDDDFFDLGGHSLLAVQLVNKIKKRTGCALPLTSLLEAPTLGALSALIGPIDGQPAAGAAKPTNNAPRPGTPGMVRIRAGGDKLPLFFVHDGLGETLLYRTLALKLDAGHPVYGLQPQMDPSGGFRHTSVAAMAAGHIESMRRVQPNGPYLLAGLCAGGVIAFEMARQLQDAGERTLFVGMIDAADVEATERPFFVTRQRLMRLSALVAGDTLSAKRMVQLVPTITRKLGNAARYEMARRRELLGRTVDRSATVIDEPSVPSFLKLYRLAHRQHRPTGLFSGGDVVLFKATQGDGSPDDMPFGEQFSDFAMGWGKRVADEVTVINIPGGHSSALQPPHVDTLARALQERLDAALRKAPSEPEVGEPVSEAASIAGDQAELEMAAS